ncbi:N-acetylmuramoyl-L-alanine amidase-like domain-containing protein [Massilia scottii]|uniref:N-acetylmuramoyl-L-alanine amidase-like domain-containing protein n=1 Tax=Massilia scottii TaxID=3057166 RepID=UPI002796B3AE|nr:N-acetylmuramoyl-L-alanine amidase-like domain-containing protein [Massilia sp. CCM 9029]MDQ1832157.1 DUF1460 domain-containing protein [Massilia sp. CCM 9029]
MRLAPLVLLSAVLAGCASAPPAPPVVAPVAVAPPPAAPEAVAPPVPEPVAAAPLAPAAPPFDLATLQRKQIYQMTPAEVGRYIAYMHTAEPDLRKRIAAIGRKNIGQPYVLNLLGEYPYELHDNLPMFSLQASDCVVFAEHTYAMALSQSWEEFFWMLQRIRYKDGVIGVATRNHYTEVDWNINNAWLVSDVSALLAGPDGPAYDMTIDRTAFLKMRHNTASNIPVQLSQEAYVTKDKVASVVGQLQDGDLVNVISTRGGKFWASHVGFIVVDAYGQRNFLNSAEPQVREESFEAFFARTAAREERSGKNGQKLAGFKFLRLNDHIVVPPAAPQPRPGAPLAAVVKATTPATTTAAIKGPAGAVTR